jgi:membrane fusion protein (multidrug efflux system)
MATATINLEESVETQVKHKKPKKKKSIVMPVILALVLLFGAIYGFQKYTYAQHHEDTDDAQLEGDINPVLPRVSGYVNTINFEENQHVNAGDTLVKLDDRDLKIKVAQAEAALENAKANVTAVAASGESSEASAAATTAAIKTAQVRLWKANQDFDRYSKLLGDHAITLQQFDVVKAEKESAEAALEVSKRQQTASRSQSSAVNQQVGVAKSVIAQRQAELDFAKLQLSYAHILAPVSGTVSKKNVQPGQLVQAGQPLVSIVSDKDLWVVANFKETQMDKIREGQPVEIEVDAYKHEKLHGKVNSISGATGAKFSLLPPDNATGNFGKVVQRVPVKISLDADKKELTKFHPGMSVKVVVAID